MSAADATQPLRGNLPTQLTRFIGREEEVATVRHLLAEHRLVTLTGAGGVGKTRLALEVASALVEDFEDGGWFADLAALADGSLVPDTVAATVRAPDHSGETSEQRLVEHLSARSCLLILDNCEHVIGACATLADRLLRACPSLVVLASSREPLGVHGEVTWRVPSLTVPDRGEAPERVAGYEAVRLFVERASAAVPEFRLTAESASPVAEICRRLDGIPLAIELAAARTRALTIQQILARLNDRFQLLTGGSRMALPRQQTLRATVDWSYNLLAEPERVLFRRLAVFSGGCTLEAVEAVCGGEGLPESVVDLLVQLVDRSLVQVGVDGNAQRERSEPRGESRYRLLETIRVYARERLEQSGESRRLRQKHAVFFRDLAERAERELWGPAQGVWLQRLEGEHDNLRAALRWLADADESESELRLAGALGMFWNIRGHRTEGKIWLDGAIERGAGASANARAKSMGWAGFLASLQSDYPRATTLMEESLTLRREMGDARGAARLLDDLGEVARHTGDYARATALLEESLDLRKTDGSRHGMAEVLRRLAEVARDRSDFSAARSLYEESLALYREVGDEHREAHALDELGGVLRASGDRERARVLHEQSLDVFRGLGDKEGMALSLANLARVARDEGQGERATALCVESLALFRELNAKWGIVECLETAASVAAAQRQSERAGRLFGAAEGLRERIRAPLPPADRAAYDVAVAQAMAANERAFLAARTAGRDLSMDEAISSVRSSSTDAEASTVPRPNVSALSAREREVAALVAEGLPNKEIAERLVIATRTAEAHVTHALTKLGLRSRAQLALWAARHGLLHGRAAEDKH